MNTRDAWCEREAVIDHLGRQLARGRLALFLGAGVSTGYGLPNWPTLLERLATTCSEAPPTPNGDPVEQAEGLRLRHFRTDYPAFLSAVHNALYQDRSIEFDVLRKDDLLVALGTLVMASKRGSVSKVVSLNYDDLLELYLEYHGFLVEPVHSDRHWVGSGDVTVLHPHGFLPFEERRQRSASIVLGTRSYLQIMEASSLWKGALQTILRSHTTLYIGLSGGDPHLQALIGDLVTAHAVHADRIAYHGLRFDVARGTDRETIMDDLGVKTEILGTWQELPPYLFRICQAARRFRICDQ